jgi:pimeloyl-ACP methyl ester carboxylesterase
MNMIPASKRVFTAIFFVFALFSFVWTQDVPATEKVATPAITGKPPIIIIPGLTGSELINATTGKKVWFSRRRAKDDDIRLPVSPNLSENRDNLVPGDIIREVRIIKLLPEVEIYERLIDSLQKRGGYREAKWDDPGENAHQDTFFVYPYDWRRDNVESARQLIRRVEDLKKKIGKADLKFNVIAHSMGGLIARYAAMYGDADIPGGTLIPTWAGAKHFDKLFLLGTPNEGSVSAIDALLNGYSYLGGGINLPFFRDISRFDVFTVPSIYQLLPAEGSLQAFDEELKPIKLDIYNPATWEEYDWGIWKDDKFEKNFSRVEQNNARPFFRAALLRAKRFQAAINANSRREVPVSLYLIGADCKDTANAIIIRKDSKKDRWITQFNAKGFARTNGEKISDDAVKQLLVTVGDGVVSKRSLAAETLTSIGKANTIPLTAEILQCETHNKLVTNSTIQDRLFEFLGAVAAALPAAK